QPRPRVASADREDGGGDPFRSGRFAGRDRAGHRRLDVEVIERTDLEIPRLRTIADVPRIGCQGDGGAGRQARSLLCIVTCCTSTGFYHHTYGGRAMGLSWQQGPLSPGAIGRFLVPEPLPKRLLYVEPLRRRMRVRFGGTWIAD